MNAPAYLVLCTNQGCNMPALYKIAAVWNDGTTEELKTYALSCDAHLEAHFRRSLDKQQSCRLVEGESLSQPQVFRVASGRRDRELVRLPDVEARFKKS
jgi:hypothetical protein